MFRRRTPADLARIDAWLRRFQAEAPILYWIAVAGISVAFTSFAFWLLDVIGYIARQG
jgi:hypothetical protein